MSFATKWAKCTTVPFLAPWFLPMVAVLLKLCQVLWCWRRFDGVNPCKRYCCEAF